MTSVPTVIRSRDNPTAKTLVALAHSSRERKKTGLTVLDGIHLVDAFLNSGRKPEYVVVAESSQHAIETVALTGRLSDAGIGCSVLADALLAEASQLESPATTMAVVRTPVSVSIPSDANAVLVLDNVQDPGNVGAMLRCAAAFAIPHALLGVGTAFAWSPKVLRAAQGAHFSLNIVEGAPVAEFLHRFGGASIALVPNAANATRLGDTDMRQPTAILVGNEGAGLSDDVLAAATQQVTIPMPGGMESLNAASCGAIAMYELSRQRQ